MGVVKISDHILHATADAIRFKTGKSGDITPREMPGEILRISGSGATSGAYKGTSLPDSELGSNGDIYIRNVPIPSHVNFVEYLESTGVQHIDTGKYGNGNMEAVLHFRTTNVTDGPVFGAREAKQSKTFSIVLENGTVRYDYGSSNYMWNRIGGNTENNVLLGRMSLNANDDIYLFSRSSFVTPCTMAMFGFNDNGSISRINVRIYRLTLIESGSVIADFLPAINDGVPCMYEAVEQTYVYNSGTGEFSYGSSISPQEAISLYVKQSGSWTPFNDLKNIRYVPAA